MRRMGFVVATMSLLSDVALAAGHDALAVSARPDGTVTVHAGAQLVASFVPKTPVDKRGVARARLATSKDRRWIEVRVAIKNTPSTEVWIGRSPSGTATVPLWTGLVGAQDKDGETTVDVAIEGDALLRFQTAGRITRCDGAPARLFVERWDEARAAFLPVLADGLAPGGVTVEARRDAAAPTGVRAFAFSAASANGDASSARELAAPAALNDGNPESVWTAARGVGSFITARASGEPAVTGVSLLVGDASGADRFRASARPTRVSLLLGPGDERRVDVQLVEDPDGGTKRFRVPFVVKLPHPVPTSCVSLYVRETTAGGAVALSDVRVLTELDGADGAAHAVAALVDAGTCDARVAEAAAFGEKALPPLLKTLAGPRSRGRVCLIEALGRILAGGGLPADAASFDQAMRAIVRDASSDEEATLVGMMKTLAGERVAALSAGLREEQRPTEERTRTVRLLAATGHPQAHAALLDMVGKPPAPLRTAVRRALAESSAPAAEDLRKELAATPREAISRRADLIFVLGTRVRREPAPDVKSALTALIGAGEPFEVEARAVTALGRFADDDAAETLRKVRSTSTDAVLRLLAFAELAHGPRADQDARAALNDGDPRVRALAAETLGRRGTKDAAALLIAGAKQEPWPMVRRAEIAALGALCTPAGQDLLVRAIERDQEDIRVAALSGLTSCRDARAGDVLLRLLRSDAESPDMRAFAARLLGDTRDARLIDALSEVAPRFAEDAAAEPEMEGLALAVVRALAGATTSASTKVLLGLANDSRAPFRRAALESLSGRCDPTAMTALNRGRTDQDEAVVAAARTALRRCSPPAR